MSFLPSELQNHLLVMLVSIAVCLLFLSILVVSDPHLTIISLIIIKHIPTFNMPTIRHVWQLIQCGNYAFSIDLKDAYLHIPILYHIPIFFTICLATNTISVESFTFWSGNSL